MHFTHQQRVNNVGSEMVINLRQEMEKYRTFLTHGINLPAGNPPGFPAFKCSGDEIKKALGDNLKPMETVIAFVLEGKSNQITKGKK